VDVAALGDKFLVIGHRVGSDEHIRETPSSRGLCAAATGPCSIQGGHRHQRELRCPRGSWLKTVGNSWLVAYGRKHGHADNPSASTAGAFVRRERFGNSRRSTIYSSRLGEQRRLFELRRAGNANSALVFSPTS
jgi:hypothetical protein